MDLPVMPPVRPMLAKAARELPDGDDGGSGRWIFEPKWDGFRCVVFRDGGEVLLASRNTKPLDRYFPEMVEAVLDGVPPRCVLDGELVIATESGLDFDALQNRVHPAASRVEMLSRETPAAFVAFDILAVGDEDLTGRPFVERRRRLELALDGCTGPIHLTPATTERARAQEWFESFEGAGLDGVMAKSGDGTYQQNRRTMLKVKHQRTADCVVAGFRHHVSGDGVGSLLLGLYRDDGTLVHVGVTASFSAARRRELLDEIHSVRDVATEDHPWASWAAAELGGQRPRAGNRWNAGKDMSWEPLRPSRVVEVAYDHLQGDRFRHSPTFLRWRLDRDPSSATFDQLAEPVPSALSEVFRS